MVIRGPGVRLSGRRPTGGPATWAGGVRLPSGGELGDAERGLYRVTVERPDGSSDEIVPAALADLGDRDNNHLLCLDTSAPAVSVSFPAPSTPIKT